MSIRVHPWLPPRGAGRKRLRPLDSRHKSEATASATSGFQGVRALIVWTGFQGVRALIVWMTPGRERRKNAQRPDPLGTRSEPPSAVRRSKSAGVAGPGLQTNRVYPCRSVFIRGCPLAEQVGNAFGRWTHVTNPRQQPRLHRHSLIRIHCWLADRGEVQARLQPPPRLARLLTRRMR